MKEETWKEYDNPNYRSIYHISNLGHVKSYPRNNPKNEIVLKGYKNAGYHAIPTRKKDGKNTLIYVHKLVAELFVPNPEDHEYIIFKNRNRSDCAAHNLTWANKEDYRAYRKTFERSAYYYRPNFKPNSKLTPAKVKMIRKMVNDPNRKTRYKQIAKQFNINIGTLFSIKRGDSWKDVE